MGVSGPGPRRPWLAALAVLALAAPARAQEVIVGSVERAEDGTPIVGARVVNVSGGRPAATDVHGRFRVVAVRGTDTLVVSALGREPARVPVPDGVAPLRVALRPATARLGDLVVTAADDTRPAADPGITLTRAQVRAMPLPVETDLLRSLQQVPGVTFSSALSARPLVRGYAADDVAFLLDGFEIVNPYHLGRAFSAFPAEAADAVTATPGAHAARHAGGLAGSVAIDGRTGGASGGRSGAALSPASLALWHGGGGAVQGFVAGRAVLLDAVDAVAESPIPYDFQDLYASLAIGRGAERRLRVTAFGSRDDLFDGSTGTGMKWSNALLGARLLALDRGRHQLTVSGSVTRFDETVRDVEARSARLDIDNEISRLALAADAVRDGALGRLRLGAHAARRDVRNTVVPLSGFGFRARDRRGDRLEYGGYADLELGSRSWQATVGVRYDAAGDARAVQPRLRVARALGPRSSLSVGAGRSARTFQLVSDAAAEPDLAFYDFWLDVGAAGVPTPTVDHVDLELALPLGRVAASVRGYLSRGRNLAELRPAFEASGDPDEPFRFGRSRTAGVELWAGWASSSERTTLTATWALGISERDWGGGWVPWQLDRRHLIRLIGRTEVGRRVTLTSAVELLSGAPLTPVREVILTGTTEPGTGGLDGSDALRGVRYVFGDEGSRRSRGTARVDLGAEYRFRGPARSAWTLAFSLSNAAFGPLATEVPRDPRELQGELLAGVPARFRHERAFDVPAIPSVMLRVEF